MFLNTCFILLETKKTRKNVDLPTTPKELPTTNRLSDLSSCSWWNFLTAWYISSLMSPLHYQAYACWGGVATSPRLMWLVATSSSHCLDKFQASISLSLDIMWVKNGRLVFARTIWYYRCAFVSGFRWGWFCRCCYVVVFNGSDFMRMHEYLIWLNIPTSHI